MDRAAALLPKLDLRAKVERKASDGRENRAMNRPWWRLGLLAAGVALAVWALPTRAAEPAPAPAAKPAITVDEKAHTVAIPAVAAKQGTYDVLKGAIEYVLVAKGGKDYETLFVTPCAPPDVYDALRKIGLRPGRPALSDAPPKGQPVRLFVEYEAAGKAVRRPLDEFLAHVKTGKPVEAAAWRFTGSTQAVNPESGAEVLQAALTRNLIGLHYDDTSPLLQNPREECRESNIYKANTQLLPPAGTAVRFVFERVMPKIAEGTRRAHVFVAGRVQGVGFRDFTENQARRLKVAGFVKNLPDGRVEAVIEGPAAAVAALVDEMRRGPRSAKVESIDVKDETPEGEFEAFDVVVEGP